MRYFRDYRSDVARLGQVLVPVRVCVPMPTFVRPIVPVALMIGLTIALVGISISQMLS